MRWRRLLLAVAMTLAGAGLAAAPAAAQSTGGDNAAAAVNTRDGSTLFKFAFSVTRALGDTVNSTNAAVAYASCTECRTVAVAFQIVFVIGSPSTFTPTNEAIAINYQCVQCDTFAAAYQFVVQAAGPVHLTADGYRRLEELEREIRALSGTTMTDAQLRAALDSYAAQIYEVLQTEVVAGPALPAATGDIGSNSTGATTSSTAPAAGAATTSTTAASSTSTSTTASTTSTTSAPTTTSAP